MRLFISIRSRCLILPLDGCHRCSGFVLPPFSTTCHLPQITVLQDTCGCRFSALLLLRFTVGPAAFSATTVFYLPAPACLHTVSPADTCQITCRSFLDSACLPFSAMLPPAVPLRYLPLPTPPADMGWVPPPAACCLLGVLELLPPADFLPFLPPVAGADYLHAAAWVPRNRWFLQMESPDSGRYRYLERFCHRFTGSAVSLRLMGILERFLPPACRFLPVPAVTAFLPALSLYRLFCLHRSDFVTCTAWVCVTTVLLLPAACTCLGGSACHLGTWVLGPALDGLHCRFLWITFATMFRHLD